MQKIMLLGKKGQLGQEIVFLAKNFAVELYPYGREELDVTDYKKVKREIDKVRPDFVINTTAYHVVADCEISPENAFLVNSIAVKNLAETCMEKKSRLVTFSTDYVFDGRKGSPYAENDYPSPLQMYGLSKLAGEIIALNYQSEAIVIRTCGVFGGRSGSRAKGGNFVLTIIKANGNTTEMEIANEQIVNPTYACDLARATLELINKKPDGGIYHLASEGYCSWSEFAQTICRIKRLPLKIIPVNKKGSDRNVKKPLFSVLANLKARELGIILPDWKEGLQRYLNSL